MTEDPKIIERRAKLRAIARRVIEQQKTDTQPKKEQIMNPNREQTGDDEFVTLSLPPVFWDDHVSRCLVTSSGTRDEYTVKSGKRTTVRISKADALELLSDAEHYADPGMAAELGWGMQFLVSSARATVAAINKQWPEQA